MRRSGTAGAIAFGSGGMARLPAGIARYDRAALQGGGEFWAHAVLVEDTAQVSVVDVRLLDGSGTVVAAIQGLRLAATAGASAEPWRQWLHVTRWVPAPAPAATCGAVLADLGDTTSLEAALDAAAAGFARTALAKVQPSEVAPRHTRLWRHLARLAARPASDSVPEGMEGALLARAGAALPDILRGTVDPLPLLFADDAVGGIYSDAPVYRAANSIVATLAAAALPPTGQVRVLEIGAGTGGTTGAVRAALDGARTDYWFTDVSPTLVAQARRRFGSEANPPAQFFCFDAERPPQEQDIPEGGFDLVLAANVLHATADLGAALDHALAAMAPDGRLLLLETAPPGVRSDNDAPGGWIDLVFGLTEGWWRFADTALRPDYPLLSRAGWQGLLESRGLDVETLALPGAHRRRWPGGASPCGFTGTAGGGLSAADRCAALLATIQDLRPDEKRLVLLTSGAQGVVEGGAKASPDGSATCAGVADPAAAALWGMMRTLRQERPELDVRCIDCPPGETDRVLASERLTAEPEIVWTLAGRFIPRVDAPSPDATAVDAPGLDEAADIALPIDPDRWVLVTGAFGGLGRFTAEWLARRGARRLVLSGRSARETEWVAALRQSGVEVRLEPCDLADATARAAMIAGLPDLGGIVHAAGVLDDATLAQARPDQFAAVLAPKLDAAMALDTAFPTLDFFILFSSAVGLFGQAGQASHVAASVALDALATARRAARPARGEPRLGAMAGHRIRGRPDRADRADGGAGHGCDPERCRGRGAGLGAHRPRSRCDRPADRPGAVRGEFCGGAGAGGGAPLADRAGKARCGGSSACGPDGADFESIVATEAAAVLGYQPGQRVDRFANLFELGLEFADGGRVAQPAAGAGAGPCAGLYIAVRAQQRGGVGRASGGRGHGSAGGSSGRGSRRGDCHRRHGMPPAGRGRRS